MTKIFVLDTSAILYDHNVLDSFAEHDIAIPITVLEELDRFKKGSNVLNYHAREFIRRLDRLSDHSDLRQWLPLDGNGAGKVRVLTDFSANGDTPHGVDGKSQDNRILVSAWRCAKENPARPVILVSKDINLRVKARTLGLEAEDYETIRVEDAGTLYTGYSQVDLPDDGLIEALFGGDEIRGSEAFDGAFDPVPTGNHYFVLRGAGKSALATLDGETGTLSPLTKMTAYGITPRNAEQTFALHAILRQPVPLVTMSGAAGTGKTLLALAGSLEQRKSFRQIYLARPVVPLSNKDIGYLPGDIDSKLGPYMQPLWDNLNVIRSQFGERQAEYQRLGEMVDNGKLQIVPLAYIRGRTLSNVIFIVDEAQNLTPHEVKTVITRAGEGTKIVFTGDVFQIDTPYLDTESNGLSYLIDRMKGHPLYAHINLCKGERSQLANLASQVL